MSRLPYPQLETFEFDVPRTHVPARLVRPSIALAGVISTILLLLSLGGCK